jgi:hypothetical protein
MELPDGLLGAPVPAAPCPRPDLHPTDATLLELPVWDALVVVRRDEAADGVLPGQAAVRCAGKLAAPVPVVPERGEKARPTKPLVAEAEAPCRRGAARFAA